jgi:hypothetical protein
LQPASPSAATARMMGIRIRVLEFNRDGQPALGLFWTV